MSETHYQRYWDPLQVVNSSFISLEHWKQRQMNSAIQYHSRLQTWTNHMECDISRVQTVDHRSFLFILVGLVKTTLCPHNLQVQTQFYPIWRLYFIQSTVYRPCYSCQWICFYIWRVSSTTSSSSKGACKRHILIFCQQWGSNPRPLTKTRTWVWRLRPLGHADHRWQN